MMQHEREQYQIHLNQLMELKRLGIKVEREINETVKKLHEDLFGGEK